MKLVIFDFDGVIADSFDAVKNIGVEVARKRGYKILNEDEIRNARKMELSEVVKKLKIPWYEMIPALNEIRREYQDQLNNIPIFSEMREIIIELDKLGIEMGIITSNSTENVSKYLVMHGIDRYFKFIFPVRGLLGKNRIIKKILKQYKNSNVEVYYVGDEVRDIIAAKKSGIKSISVSWGYNSEEVLIRNNPDFLIKNPNDLLSIIVN